MKLLMFTFIMLFTLCYSNLSLRLSDTFDVWNIDSLISASNVCSNTVQPPVIHVVTGNNMSYLLSDIVPHLGPTVVQTHMPFRGPTLVVLHNADLKEVETLSWNPENCYVCYVLNDSVSPQKLLLNLWHNHKLHYVFVVKGNSKVVSFNPFRKRFAQSSVARLETFDNLNGAPMRIVMFSRPPILIQLKHNQYTGVDGEMLHLLQSKMNFKMVVSGTSDNQRYGYRLDNGSYVGTLKDILQGNVDLAINGHFIKDYGNDNLSFTHPVLNDKLCALVPKAGLVPHLFVFTRCFSPEVWASVLISYIAIALMQYIIKYLLNKKTSKVIFNIIQNIFNVGSPQCPAIMSERLCQVVMLFFTFIIVNAFQGQIITFLNTPTYFSEIDTLQEIDESNLEIFSSKAEVETMLEEDAKLRSLARKVHTLSDQEVQCAAKTRDIVRFSRYSHIDKVALALKENLHLVSECLSSYHIGYVLPRTSPFLERINTLISRAIGSGLIQYWSSSVGPDFNNANKERAFSVLSISDLQIAFIILAVGLSLSIVIFFAELIVFQNTISKRLTFQNKKEK